MTNELKDLEIRLIQLESKVNDGKQISYEDAKKQLPKTELRDPLKQDKK